MLVEYLWKIETDRQIPVNRQRISVTGKRGNVEINDSSQAGIEVGASRFKIVHCTKWAQKISDYCS